MHRKFKTVVCASPSVPHARTTRANRPRPAAWHCLGFTGVMCALLGCATTTSSARSAESERQPGGLAAGDAALPETVPASKAPASLTSATHGAADAADTADAELPWLSPSHIGAAVREHQGDFQACQALGDLMSRREDGSVTVGWAVQANGTVKHVAVGHSSFGSASINACILGVAQQVKFPASAAPTHVSWTVKFRGAAHEPMADARPR